MHLVIAEFAQTVSRIPANEFERLYLTHTSPSQQKSSPSQQKPAKKQQKDPVAQTKDKKITKQRSNDRRHKIEAQNSDIDLGHVEDSSAPLLIPPTEGSVSRSSSDHSGSLLYGKTLHPPRNGVLLGKSSSLIFPTGVEAPEETPPTKTREINLRLDQCETIRWPIKKKLILENMQLSAADIPVQYLFGTPLGNTLHKLSLAKNRLSSIPVKLVQCLPTLKHLDLSQCELVTLPEVWNLGQLRKLNLSHNKLTDFPDEVRKLSRYLKKCLLNATNVELTITDNARRPSRIARPEHVWQQGGGNHRSWKSQATLQTRNSEPGVQ